MLTICGPERNIPPNTAQQSSHGQLGQLGALQVVQQDEGHPLPPLLEQQLPPLLEQQLPPPPLEQQPGGHHGGRQLPPPLEQQLPPPLEQQPGEPQLGGHQPPPGGHEGQHHEGGREGGHFRTQPLGRGVPLQPPPQPLPKELEKGGHGGIYIIFRFYTVMKGRWQGPQVAGT